MTPASSARRCGWSARAPGSDVRAAVLRRHDAPLDLDEVPDAHAHAGTALVRVRSVGLCGTDLKIVAGQIPGLPLPLIPGHEVAGELVEDAGELRAGQRVAAYILESCGTCRACRRGDTEVCSVASRIGFERDGGLAELIEVPVANLLPFANHLPFEHAAVAMDAVLVPWRALHHRARVRPGETVLVVGAGGLGLNGVQVAVAAGCRVAVVDPVAANRDLATGLGAELALDPDGALEALAAWAGDGVDAALEVSGAPAGFRLGTEALRAGGVIVCSGYQPGADYAVDSMRLAIGQLRIEGNRGGNLEHAREALAAVERGEICPLIDRVAPLEVVNELLDTLRTGRVAGRLVVQLP